MNRLRRLGASLAACSRSPRGVGCLMACLVLLLLMPVWLASSYWYEQRLREASRAQLAATLSSYANSLAMVVNRRLAALDTLEAFVILELEDATDVSAEHFADMVSRIFQDDAAIGSLSIAPGGMQQFVYPLRGNEHIPGKNLLADASPNLRADVQRAVASGDVVITGPYILPQGGMGLAATRAIFRHGAFWGLAGLVLDLPVILSDAGLDDLPDDLSLVVLDDSRLVFFGDSSLLMPDMVEVRVSLPDGGWTLLGAPTAGWSAAIHEQVLVFSGAGLLILLLFASQVYLVAGRQANLRLAVNRRTGQLSAANRELLKEIAERQQVEQALRDSQETLRTERDRVQTYLDVVEVMIVALDVTGTITLINRKGCRLMGYDEDELIGRDWFQTCLPAEYTATVREVFRQLMDGQLSVLEFHENPVVTKAGTERLVSWHNTILRDEEGRISGTLSAGEDITESRSGENMLRQQASQLAGLRRIGLDLATVLDLKVLLHSIVEQATALVAGMSGGLYLYKPDEDVIEWQVAIGPGLAHTGAKLRRGEGVSGKAWQRNETLIVNHYENWPGKAEIFRGNTWGSVLAVPVRWREEFLGVLDIVSDALDAFSPSDGELMELFASHAAVAIQNARLFERERQQRSVAEALAQASVAVSSSLDSTLVMDRILEQVSRVVPCDAANIMLSQDGSFRIVRWRGYERFGAEDFVSTVNFAAELVPNLVKLVETGRSLLIPDTTLYPDWYQAPEQAWLRSYAAAPIQVQGRVVGVLNVDSATPGHFTPQQLLHLEAFAAQAASAFQNARLYQEVREYAEQLEARVLERTQELQQRVHEVERLNLAMVNLLEDLSEANQLATESARKLQAANADLEAFAYSVSHDLRAPLRAIVGFSQIIQRRHAESLDTEGRHYLDNIVKASDHMSTLIDDLLAYARIGRRAVHRQPVALAAVINGVLQNLQPAIRDAAAEVCVSDEMPVVWGDPTLLGQVFGNLLDNALIYRRPGIACRVVVEARRNGDQVIVSVADNGIGIAREHHDKIFNVFQRLHAEGSIKGNGIGLAIVKKAVDLLDGQISVESIEGQGSTFRVHLSGPS